MQQLRISQLLCKHCGSDEQTYFVWLLSLVNYTKDFRKLHFTCDQRNTHDKHNKLWGCFACLVCLCLLLHCLRSGTVAKNLALTLGSAEWPPDQWFSGLKIRCLEKVCSGVWRSWKPMFEMCLLLWMPVFVPSKVSKVAWICLPETLLSWICREQRNNHQQKHVPPFLSILARLFASEWRPVCLSFVGCAFVTYANRQCAQNAIKSMHHSQTMEVSLCVSCQPRAEDGRRIQGRRENCAAVVSANCGWLRRLVLRHGALVALSVCCARFPRCILTIPVNFVRVIERLIRSQAKALFHGEQLRLFLCLAVEPERLAHRLGNGAGLSRTTSVAVAFPCLGLMFVQRTFSDTRARAHCGFSPKWNVMGVDVLPLVLQKANPNLEEMSEWKLAFSWHAYASSERPSGFVCVSNRLGGWLFMWCCPSSRRCNSSAILMTVLSEELGKRYVAREAVD